MKHLRILITAMLIAWFAQVDAQTPISALPTLTAPDSSADYIPIVHSGTTYKVTPGKLFHEFGASGGSGSPGGSNTHIQYNNAGAFAGSSYLTWNNSTQNLTVSTSTYPSSLFNLFNANGYVTIGDYAADVNGTALFLNDNLQQINLSAGGGGILLDGAGSDISFYGVSTVTFISPILTTGQAAISLHPYLTGAGNTGELRFLELAANGSNYTGFKSPDSRSANLIYTLPSTDPTSGDVLVAGVPSGGVVGLTWATIGGTGTVTSIATTSPITGGTITTTGTIGIDNAAADGTTKGAASFTAADFNSSTGLISIDYTNGQKAAADGTTLGFATFTAADFNATTGLISLDYANGQEATAGQDGFLNSTDWSTFNSKVGTGVTTLSSLASIGTVTTGTWNASVIAGQYGGTGVANTGKTLTLSGNTTIGSSTHTVDFATGANTSVTLPASGTLATLAGTETFTNKSIVGTQLTGTSYTFAANNTGSTAAYTLQPYEDHDLATYSGTVDYNGTDPSSITSQQYAWSRVGNTVTLFFSIFYGTPGVTNTSATITMPSDCPAPATFATAGDAASEYIFPVNGARVESNQTANPSAVRGGLRRNSTNDGYEVLLIFGSVSATHTSFTLTYRTQ